MGEGFVFDSDMMHIEGAGACEELLARQSRLCSLRRTTASTPSSSTPLATAARTSRSLAISSSGKDSWSPARSSSTAPLSWHSWQVDHLPWGEFADWRCCTQVPHTVHGMHAMHSVDLPRSVGCSQHPQDLGVGRGQAEWVMTRGAVAGSEVGDNQTRPQRVGPRCQMRVV